MLEDREHTNEERDHHYMTTRSRDMLTVMCGRGARSALNVQSAHPAYWNLCSTLKHGANEREGAPVWQAC